MGWVDHPLGRAVPELVELQARHPAGGMHRVPVSGPGAASHVAAAWSGEEDLLAEPGHGLQMAALVLLVADHFEVGPVDPACSLDRSQMSEHVVDDQLAVEGMVEELAR